MSTISDDPWQNFFDAITKPENAEKILREYEEMRQEKPPNIIEQLTRALEGSPWARNKQSMTNLLMTLTK